MTDHLIKHVWQPSMCQIEWNNVQVNPEFTKYQCKSDKTDAIKNHGCQHKSLERNNIPSAEYSYKLITSHVCNEKHGILIVAKK